MKKTSIAILPLIDFILVPFVVLAVIFLKTCRPAGSKRLPLNTQILRCIDVFPIRGHYYEPLLTMLI